MIAISLTRFLDFTMKSGSPKFTSLRQTKKQLADAAKEIFSRYPDAPERVETAIAEKFLRMENLNAVTSSIDPLSLVKKDAGNVKIDTDNKAIICVKDHLDRTGTIAVAGNLTGAPMHAGLTRGGDPHLLFAHDMKDPWGVAVSPDSRWIASGGSDGAVRLFPMPDLSKPPLHTLPHDELIAKLKTLTNRRVVRDDESSTGWKSSLDPFPGWETVPTW